MNKLLIAICFDGFPAPLEVDRYLYLLMKKLKRQSSILGFRPLARQIGSYTDQTYLRGYTSLFPTPREVDRQLYSPRIGSSRLRSFVSGPSRGRQVSIQEVEFKESLVSSLVSGPSRDRQVAIQKVLQKVIAQDQFSFPAPLEVDRQLYVVDLPVAELVIPPFPAPLEVDRYLYIQKSLKTQMSFLLSFRPLARQIGIYTQ